MVIAKLFAKNTGFERHLTEYKPGCFSKLLKVLTFEREYFALKIPIFTGHNDDAILAEGRLSKMAATLALVRTPAAA